MKSVVAGVFVAVVYPRSQIGNTMLTILRVVSTVAFAGLSIAPAWAFDSQSPFDTGRWAFLLAPNIYPPGDGGLKYGYYGETYAPGTLRSSYGEVTLGTNEHPFVRINTAVVGDDIFTTGSGSYYYEFSVAGPSAIPVLLDTHITISGSATYQGYGYGGIGGGVVISTANNAPIAHYYALAGAGTPYVDNLDGTPMSMTFGSDAYLSYTVPANQAAGVLG